VAFTGRHTKQPCKFREALHSLARTRRSCLFSEAKIVFGVRVRLPACGLLRHSTRAKIRVPRYYSRGNREHYISYPGTAGERVAEPSQKMLDGEIQLWGGGEEVQRTTPLVVHSIYEDPATRHPTRI
jgi:hypothetical protein